MGCLEAALRLTACAADGPPQGTASTPFAAPPASVRSDDWRHAYDLDGDLMPDDIVYEFSGGAHCCYRVGASLSSTGKTLMLPFQMDGGYVAGLDLGQPQQFAIRVPDGGLPEILMEIESYNGTPAPLDHSLTSRFGIRTHRVAVCFADGEISVRDFTPTLAPCKPRSR